MEGAYEGTKAPQRRGSQGARKVAEKSVDYRNVTAATLAKVVSELESQMYQHAENLEFEQAAAIRDRIKKVKEKVLKKPGMV
jgi:excinuclease ABC subunit B